MVETVQNRHWCQKPETRKGSIHKFNCRISTLGRIMECYFVSLCSLRHGISRMDETSFFKPSSFFQKSLVDRKDIGKLTEQFAEEEGLKSQPRKMVVSSIKIQNRTLIAPLLLFYLELGFVSATVYRFVEYTPKKCFNNIVESAVGAAKAEVGDMELDFVGFSNFQFPKLKTLKFYYIFSDKFCVIDKFEQLELDTNSLYLLLLKTK